MGRDGAVRELVEKAALAHGRLAAPAAGGGAAPVTAGAYASAAIPARYALERGDWAAAAALTPVSDGYPPAIAIAHFARAIGAARAGQAESARSDLDRLAFLRDDLKARRDEYWAGQVGIQWRAAGAWAAWAQGRKDEAIAQATAAADAEDATEKAAVSPGPLAPARELLADMLLESGRHDEARRAYEAVLKKEPGRLRTEFGAGLAAERAGDRTASLAHYRTLLAMCDQADQPGREALQHAREALSTGSGSR
jgi:tetratricopeptide (TPR) repeat protein